ncbi:MAG: sigma-70 family RNA polymerase sigma factor [Christensenellales bacterium]
MSGALVPGAQKEQKLEAWLTAYGDAVLRMCFVYLSDRTLAEDALQDTFLKVWRRMDSFEGRNEASAKTWIMRIAINTCKDYRRSAWFRHVDMAKAIEDMPLSAPDTTDESRALFMDVMRLPDKLKQVILLYYFHNLTMAETAEALGISRQAVQYRLNKAYQLLGDLPERSDRDE